jgi:hypothetical protein
MYCGRKEWKPTGSNQNMNLELWAQWAGIWIAERIEEYNVGDASPQAAHLEYKDWKPPTLKK